MRDLNDTIQQVLQNPAKMQQIMDMAAAMGFPQNPDEADRETPQTDHRQEALINALLPYLHPHRQSKLRRAAELSRMTQLAAAALQNRQPEQPSAEEVIHV